MRIVDKIYKDSEIKESKDELLKMLSRLRIDYIDCISRYQGTINMSSFDSAKKRREELKSVDTLLFKYLPDHFPFGID